MQIDFCRCAHGLKANLAMGPNEIRAHCFLLVFFFHSWKSICKELTNRCTSKNAYILLAKIGGKWDKTGIADWHKRVKIILTSKGRAFKIVIGHISVKNVEIPLRIWSWPKKSHLQEWYLKIWKMFCYMPTEIWNVIISGVSKYIIS